MKVKRQPTIKELKTALNVLTTYDIGVEVPDELLVALSEMVQHKEQQTLTRRLSRMSEEELIKFEGRRRQQLRILLPDGRLLQGKTNDATFVMALKEIGKERLCQTAISFRQHPLLMYDESETRQRMNNYYLLMPGVFLFAKTKSAEKKRALEKMDEKLELNWTISLV